MSYSLMSRNIGGQGDLRHIYALQWKNNSFQSLMYILYLYTYTYTIYNYYGFSSEGDKDAGFLSKLTFSEDYCERLSDTGSWSADPRIRRVRGSTAPNHGCVQSG